MKHLYGPLCAIFATLGFSSRAIFIKLVYQNSSVDPTTLLALRMLIALPFFVGMMLWARQSNSVKISRKEVLILIAMGMVGFYLSSYLDLMGLQYISASLERLILFLYPTMVVVLSAVLARRMISPTEISGLLISYAGILMVFLQDLRQHHMEVKPILIGGGLVFAAAITYAIYLVGSQNLVKKMGSTRYTGWVMLCSCSAALVQFSTFNAPERLLEAKPVIGLVVMIAVFGTVLPTWLLAKSIKVIGANRTAAICTLGPVMTMGFSAWMLGESMSLVQILGAGLVIIGVVTLSTPDWPKAALRFIVGALKFKFLSTQPK